MLGSVDLATSSDEKEGEKMEYVYAAMLLHSAEKEIDENGVSAVLTPPEWMLTAPVSRHWLLRWDP